MRIAAHRGACLHSPENSIAALISGYTGGADVLEIGLQLTRDGHLVLSHEATTDALTGVSGTIAEKTLAQLRELDFSRRFQPRNSPNFRYYVPPPQKRGENLDARRLAIETFPAALEVFPEQVELLIELGDVSAAGANRRDELVRKTADALSSRGVMERCVVTSLDAGALRALRGILPAIRIVTCDDSLPHERQVELMASMSADGLVADVEDLVENGALTAFAKAVKKAFEEKRLRVGAVARPPRGTGVFTEPQWRALRDKAFVWSLGTDSLIDVSFTRRSVVLTDERFAGRRVDRERFALGYAKANRFCTVTQDDGIHVRIDPYPEIPSPADPMEQRLQAIEERLTEVARGWPFYSGGGVGYVPGIRGDFAAEVDYTVQNVTQATTLEMAVVNVDPGAHQSHPPVSFRNKDSFYDPHGAPPFVGVEHDEDDGYRINWNLGSEYDSNQYGRPVGDGKTPRGGRLRLERRGSYFSGYYRNTIDAIDWVCCGVARNDSLNRVVYLRCVGKRWRQESESDPSVFVPIVPNHFVFRNLRIERFLD
jgi:glycerophosphoryl diester phosphodiesterase